jgi:hypothetical protein
VFYIRAADTTPQPPQRPGHDSTRDTCADAGPAAAAVVGPVAAAAATAAAAAAGRGDSAPAASRFEIIEVPQAALQSEGFDRIVLHERMLSDHRTRAYRGALLRLLRALPVDAAPADGGG